ncbi:methylase [Enterococcus sp. JM4C]|uniref:class I SAM-dependent methyltransferase n=1 Tax=Candidatus Enterococcus huntleyi TaxID=1857217 RepID=UPI00137B672D|nr:methyltransferase domain-containing protein [Enterococcus sp. JM4C]KAF1296470.1 methylase [Enterococcus sp. JM4C]
MEKIFDRLAKQYDSLDRKALAEIISKKFSEELRDAKEKKLLDYGGGTGLVSLPLAHRVQKLAIVDASEPMVQLAQAKILADGLKNSTAEVGDLFADSIKETYDLVLLSLVLLHIPDTEGILTRLNQVLNAGGQLILVDFVKNRRVSHPKVHNGFEEVEIKAAVEKSGFVLTKFEPFYEGKEIFMRQDATLFIAVATKK